MSETRTTGPAEADTADDRIALGQELRRARELRNVTLAQLASETRIALRHIQALEEDRLDDLPGQLYARNFVRTIARTLGADEEGLLEVFDYQAGRGGERSPSEAGVAAGGARRVAFVALGAAVLITAAVLALAGWKAFGTGSSDESAASREANVPTPEPEPAANVATVARRPEPFEPALAPNEPRAEARVADAAPAEADAAPTEPVAEAKPPLDPAAVPETRQLAPAEAEPAVPRAAAPAERAEAVEDLSPAAPPAPSPPPAVVEPAGSEEPAPPEARLVFSGPSWIEIVPQGRGEQIMGLKTAGQTVSFRLDSAVEVTVANAGNVELWIAGRPARPLGAHGERRTMKLDARNWQSFLR